ncbi:hypothetical protein IW261DRAFT_348705 [Armillaria novae-zelandiae]|uniref:DUF6534 domain-containing protein n=1 Tax=Armillaria novae-zelandiae TaxID=153914 RepID=A0AA39PQZ1_9AGAR|nr:hypothetical protein IW261DRAFT_348705 [Armillaria novae-zelandiae]
MIFPDTNSRAATSRNIRINHFYLLRIPTCSTHVFGCPNARRRNAFSRNGRGRSFGRSIDYCYLVIYYRRYPQDPRLFRYSILLFWILDTLQLALVSSALYFYLVTSHGDCQTMLMISWSLRSQNTVSRIIIVGIQGLYVVRIWKLGLRFSAVLPWCSLVSVGANLAATIYAFYATYSVQGFLSLSSVNAAITTVFSTTAVSDIAIAIIMCFCLHKGKEMTRVSSTIKIIETLMRLVIMSGSTTSVCSLLVLFSRIAWPDSLIFLAFDMIISKLYMNSLLAMLNYRKIPLELALNLGHPISIPTSSGAELEFSPNESGETAV